MTKEEALKILDKLTPEHPTFGVTFRRRRACLVLLDALDAAGAFTPSLTDAERQTLEHIDECGGVECCAPAELRFMRELERRGLVSVSGGRGPARKFHRVELTSDGHKALS